MHTYFLVTSNHVTKEKIYLKSISYLRERERERERERSNSNRTSLSHSVEGLAICTTGTGKRAWSGQINYICPVQTPF